MTTGGSFSASVDCIKWREMLYYRYRRVDSNDIRKIGGVL